LNLFSIQYSLISVFQILQQGMINNILHDSDKYKQQAIIQMRLEQLIISKTYFHRDNEKTYPFNAHAKLKISTSNRSL